MLFLLKTSLIEMLIDKEKKVLARAIINYFFKEFERANLKLGKLLKVMIMRKV